MLYKETDSFRIKRMTMKSGENATKREKKQIPNKSQTGAKGFRAKFFVLSERRLTGCTVECENGNKIQKTN